ncbi:NMD3-domain-containing protein [Mycena rebaudengoi]|nr:NMD3-domain-containing protein [Mycena rebaudengoi]
MSPKFVRTLRAAFSVPLLTLLGGSVDITEGIPKQASVSFCRNCERFLSPPQSWTLARPESPELLSILRLTEAHFIWTEPHSKRLRVSMTIQKETFEARVLSVQHGHWLATNTWKALVHVRQKVPPQADRSLFPSKHAHPSKARRPKRDTSARQGGSMDGLDFFYQQRSHAIKMVEFLVEPLNPPSSLLSSDTHTNTANYKFTYSVEIVARVQGRLVCIPPKQARAMSNISPLAVCSADISSASYWRTPVESLATVSDLVEFTVLDVEPDGGAPRASTCLQTRRSRSPAAFRAHADGDGMDFEDGRAAQIFHTRTAPRRDPAAGRHCARLPPHERQLPTRRTLAALPASRIPDIVLVKKAARSWRLRSIGKEAGEEGETGGGRGGSARSRRTTSCLLRELEEDPEMRGAVNLYKAPEGRPGGKGRRRAQFAMDVDMVAEEAPPERVRDVGIPGDDDEEEEEADFPEIKLDELLEGFDEMTLGADDTAEEDV